MNNSLRSVAVAVSGEAEQAGLLDALMIDPNDYDVIVMESMARGYSRIKELTPDLIVVFLQIDDEAGCQLLSMLRIDSQVARIPVVTLAAQREQSDLQELIVAVNRELSCRINAIEMN